MTNPLSKHFRQPAIYLKLPSGGRFWPEGSLDPTPSGELPVFPMTIRDEIALKTPDALMNGAGVAEMITSCIPNIRDPYACPTVDLDAVLIAIRLASYGQGMDINSACTHCKETNESTLNLNTLLDNVRMIGYDDLQSGELKFEFKPQTFRDINIANLAAFEEQRLLSIVGSDQFEDEEKNRKFKESFERLTNLNLESVINSIRSIITMDGTRVSDREQIKEFFDNCDRKTYDNIRAKIESFNRANKLKPVNLNCEHCNKDYQAEITFDQSNFFG
jgi:hypothetical protein